MNQVKLWNEYVTKYWAEYYEPDVTLTYPEHIQGYFRVTLTATMTWSQFSAAYLAAENIFEVFSFSFVNGKASLELAFYGTQPTDDPRNKLIPPELLI